MGQQFTISEIGLKLIKSYEGYRPDDRTLMSGQKVVGYGHRLQAGESSTLTKDAASTVLMSDLQPIEDLINDNVHAPLTQSQFDALCSLVFNIGPQSFLKSDLLRALNNGRPLDAANAFDVWRKSEIDGKTYVVDALVRRRTAEKALFLQIEGEPLSASSADLPPEPDDNLAHVSTHDGLPVISADSHMGHVETVPYDAQLSQFAVIDDDYSDEDIMEEISSDETQADEILTEDVKVEDAPTEDISTDESSVEDETLTDTGVDFDEVLEIETPTDMVLDDADEAEDIPLNNLSFSNIPDVPDSTLPEPTTITWDSQVPTDTSAEDENNGEDDTLGEEPLAPSRIAEAAAEVSERLDALIEDTRNGEINETLDASELSESDEPDETQKRATPLIQSEPGRVLHFPGNARHTPFDLGEKRETPPPTLSVEDEIDFVDGSDAIDMPAYGAEGDPKRTNGADSAAKYIRKQGEFDALRTSGIGPYALMVAIGMALIAGFLVVMHRGPTEVLGTSGPFTAFAGLMIGAMIFLGAIYKFFTTIVSQRRV